MTTSLPPNDSSAMDDKLPGEAELAALYRQLPQSEPAPALDAAVLQAAAQALDDAASPPRTERRKGARESGDWVHPESLPSAAQAIPSIEVGARRRRRVPPWVVAMGSAASLVLVAGLAWHMRTVPGEKTMQADHVAPPAPMVAAPPHAARMAESADARPAAAQKQAVANQARRQAIARGASDTAAAASMTERAAPPKPARHRAPPQSTKPAADKVRAVRIPAPAAMAMPPPVEQPSAAPEPVLPPPPAPQASLLPMSLAVDAQLSTKKAAEIKGTPAQELDAIQQLFAHGQDDEARQRLLEFRRVHPHWPLPPALQAQLPKP